MADFTITGTPTPTINTIVSMETIVLHLELNTVKPKDQAWLNAMQPRAEQAIRRHIGYDPVYAERTEYVPATYGYRREDPMIRDFDVRGNRLVTEWGGPAEGSMDLIMPSVPIRSVLNLWEN